MRPISREMKLDPTQTKTFREDYEQAVVRLIKEMWPNFAAIVQKAEDLLKQQKPDDFDQMVHDLFEQRFVDPAKPMIKQEILKSYVSGQKMAQRHIKRIHVGARMGTLPPNPTVLAILEARNIAALKGISDEMAKKIKESLTESIILGRSAEDKAEALVDAVMLPMKRARVIARTEVAYAHNTALVEEFKRYGIEKVEWVSAPRGGSKKLCDECAKLDGKVFEINNHPPCPYHPNCRCTLIAKVEEI